MRSRDRLLPATVRLGPLAPASGVVAAMADRGLMWRSRLCDAPSGLDSRPGPAFPLCFSPLVDLPNSSLLFSAKMFKLEGLGRRTVRGTRLPQVGPATEEVEPVAVVVAGRLTTYICVTGDRRQDLIV